MSDPRRAIALLLALAACGGASGDDGGEVDDPAASEPLFWRDHVMEVAIDLDAADWDSLRLQTNTWVGLFSGDDCMAQPFESPFTYFPGRISIDGQVFDQVGVRKKGFFGSMSDTKPSLKIHLDEYIDGQELLGLDKLTFNNVRQDPSFLRTCMAYDLFAAAGVPAPLCSFAHLTVNQQDLGLYVHVESLDRQFLERRWADPSGLFYEGTLSDFRPEYRSTFELKTDDAVDDGSRLDAVMAAAAAPDDELMAALAPIIDLDAFYTYWAMEALTSHWDGYASNTNNFYLYDDPTSGRFAFIPWGADATFGPNPAEEQPLAIRDSVFATAILPWRLYRHPDGQAAYLARLRELIDTVWDPDALAAKIDRLEWLIAPYAPDGLAAAVDEVRAAVASQRDVLMAELDGPPIVWDGGLRDDFCLDHLGAVNVAFSTTWGTHGAADPLAAGDGSWNVLQGEAPLVATDVGSTAGLDPNDPNWTVITMVAPLSDGHIAVLYLRFQTSVFAPGTHDIDWARAIGDLYHVDGGGNTTRLGLLGAGQVTLDAAAMTAGAPVSGSVTAELVRSPW